ncbi:MAG TPA: hypothetical protein VIT65_27540 [Microlunatus sp.]
MRDALRSSAAALKAEGVPFALAGSYALWVFGGPEGDHDVDLVVPEVSVEEAVRTLGCAGFVIDRPPEDWLFKAWWDKVMVDVLHRLVGVPVDLDLVRSAEEHDVLGVRMPVLAPTVVMTTKVLSLSERYCDLATLLPGARAVRERVDWPQVRAAAAGQPYAETFLFLATRLGIID